VTLRDPSPTTRLPAWRLLVAVVAFATYLLAGMHIACAGDFAALVGGGSHLSAGGEDDDSKDGHAPVHCHAAHMQAHGTGFETPQPGVSASRVALSADAARASVAPPRLEHPPRG